MKKRLLAIFLAICIAVTSLSTDVFAVTQSAWGSQFEYKTLSNPVPGSAGWIAHGGYRVGIAFPKLYTNVTAKDIYHSQGHILSQLQKSQLQTVYSHLIKVEGGMAYVSTETSAYGVVKQTDVPGMGTSGVASASALSLDNAIKKAPGNDGTRFKDEAIEVKKFLSFNGQTPNEDLMSFKDWVKQTDFFNKYAKGYAKYGLSKDALKVANVVSNDPASVGRFIFTYLGLGYVLGVSNVDTYISNYIAEIDAGEISHIPMIVVEDLETYKTGNGATVLLTPAQLMAAAAGIPDIDALYNQEDLRTLYNTPSVEPSDIAAVEDPMVKFLNYHWKSSKFDNGLNCEAGKMSSDEAQTSAFNGFVFGSFGMFKGPSQKVGGYRIKQGEGLVKVGQSKQVVDGVETLVYPGVEQFNTLYNHPTVSNTGLYGVMYVACGLLMPGPPPKLEWTPNLTSMWDNGHPSWGTTENTDYINVNGCEEQVIEYPYPSHHKVSVTSAGNTTKPVDNPQTLLEYVVKYGGNYTFIVTLMNSNLCEDVDDCILTRQNTTVNVASKNSWFVTKDKSIKPLVGASQGPSGIQIQLSKDETIRLLAGKSAFYFKADHYKNTPLAINQRPSVTYYTTSQAFVSIFGAPVSFKETGINKLTLHVKADYSADVTDGDGEPDGTPTDGTPPDGDGTPDDGTPSDGTPSDGTPSNETVTATPANAEAIFTVAEDYIIQLGQFNKNSVTLQSDAPASYTIEYSLPSDNNGALLNLLKAKDYAGNVTLDIYVDAYVPTSEVSSINYSVVSGLPSSATKISNTLKSIISSNDLHTLDKVKTMSSHSTVTLTGQEMYDFIRKGYNGVLLAKPQGTLTSKQVKVTYTFKTEISYSDAGTTKLEKVVAPTVLTLEDTILWNPEAPSPPAGASIFKVTATPKDYMFNDLDEDDGTTHDLKGLIATAGDEAKDLVTIDYMITSESKRNYYNNLMDLAKGGHIDIQIWRRDTSKADEAWVKPNNLHIEEVPPGFEYDDHGHFESEGKKVPLAMHQFLDGIQWQLEDKEVEDAKLSPSNDYFWCYEYKMEVKTFDVEIGTGADAITIQYKLEGNPDRDTNSWQARPLYHYASELTTNYAELKMGDTTIYEERWEAMSGTPTTANLYYAVGGDEFVIQSTMSMVKNASATRKYKYQATLTYCDNNNPYTHGGVPYSMIGYDGVYTMSDTKEGYWNTPKRNMSRGESMCRCVGNTHVNWTNNHNVAQNVGFDKGGSQNPIHLTASLEPNNRTVYEHCQGHKYYFTTTSPCGDEGPGGSCYNCGGKCSPITDNEGHTIGYNPCPYLANGCWHHSTSYPSMTQWCTVTRWEPTAPPEQVGPSGYTPTAWYASFTWTCSNCGKTQSFSNESCAGEVEYTPDVNNYYGQVNDGCWDCALNSEDAANFDGQASPMYHCHHCSGKHRPCQPCKLTYKAEWNNTVYDLCYSTLKDLKIWRLEDAITQASDYVPLFGTKVINATYNELPKAYYMVSTKPTTTSATSRSERIYYHFHYEEYDTVDLHKAGWNQSGKNAGDGMLYKYVMEDNKPVKNDSNNLLTYSNCRGANSSGPTQNAGQPLYQLTTYTNFLEQYLLKIREGENYIKADRQYDKKNRQVFIVMSDYCVLAQHNKVTQGINYFAYECAYGDVDIVELEKSGQDGYDTELYLAEPDEYGNLYNYLFLGPDQTSRQQWAPRYTGGYLSLTGCNTTASIKHTNRSVTPQRQMRSLTLSGEEADNFYIKIDSSCVQDSSAAYKEPHNKGAGDRDAIYQGENQGFCGKKNLLDDYDRNLDVNKSAARGGYGTSYANNYRNLMWFKNKACAQWQNNENKRNYGYINEKQGLYYGGYNGNYASPGSKYDNQPEGQLPSFFSSLNSHGSYLVKHKNFWSQASGTYLHDTEGTIRQCTQKRFLLGSFGMDVYDTCLNGAYYPEVSKVFYHNLCNLDTTIGPNYSIAHVGWAGDKGFECNTKYCPGSEFTCNPIIIYNPISVDGNIEVIKTNEPYYQWGTWLRDGTQALIDDRIPDPEGKDYGNRYTYNIEGDGILVYPLLGTIRTGPATLGLATLSTQTGYGWFNPGESPSQGQMISGGNTVTWCKDKQVVFENYVIVDTNGNGDFTDEQVYAPYTVIDLDKFYQNGQEITQYKFYFPLIANEFKECRVFFEANAINDSNRATYNNVEENNICHTSANQGSYTGCHDNTESFAHLCLSKRPLESDYNYLTAFARVPGDPHPVCRHHDATRLVRIDVVGFIGNMAMTDVGDFRYSNFFKENENTTGNPANNKWVVDNTVYTVDTSKQARLVVDDVDIFDRKPTEELQYYNSYSLQPYKSEDRSKNGQYYYSFPLMPYYNNIEGYRNAGVRVGYDAFLDIETIGQYDEYGSNLKVLYSYYAVNTSSLSPGAVNTALQPVDVYMISEGRYELINDFENIKDVYQGSYTYVDWDHENARRMYCRDLLGTLETDSEEEMTSYVYASKTRKNTVYDDFDRVIRLPDQAPDGARTVIGDRNTLYLNDDVRTFIGNYFVNTEVQGFNPVEVPLKFTDLGYKFGLADFGENSQKWYFNCGLPSSSVFVAKGQPCTRANIEAINSKYDALIAVAYIYAIGPVWTLQHNGSTSWGRFEEMPNKPNSDPTDPNTPSITPIYPSDLPTSDPTGPVDPDDPLGPTKAPKVEPKGGPNTPTIPPTVIMIQTLPETSRDDVSIIGTH